MKRPKLKIFSIFFCTCLSVAYCKYKYKSKRNDPKSKHSSHILKKEVGHEGIGNKVLNKKLNYQKTLKIKKGYKINQVNKPQLITKVSNQSSHEKHYDTDKRLKSNKSNHKYDISANNDQKIDRQSKQKKQFYANEKYLKVVSKTNKKLFDKKKLTSNKASINKLKSMPENTKIKKIKTKKRNYFKNLERALEKKSFFLKMTFKNNWTDKDTKQLTTLVNVFIKKTKKSLKKLLDVKNKINKNFYSEIQSNGITVEKPTIILLKTIKYNVFESINIINKFSRIIFLNSSDIYLNAKICENLIEYIKAIATLQKLTFYDTWFYDMMGDTFYWSEVCYNTAVKIENTYKKGVEGNLNFEGYLESTLERLRQYKNSITKELDLINKIKNNDSSSQINFKIENIIHIVNYASIEYLCAKYIYVAVFKKEPKLSKDFIQSFTNIENLYAEILELQNQSLKIKKSNTKSNKKFSKRITQKLIPNWFRDRAKA